MKIHFTGKNIEVTPALKNHTIEKMQKLEKRDKNLQDLHVTFSIENVTQIAEGTFHYHGVDLHAKASSKDLYAAIDDLANKLLAQLTTHKEKITNHHS